MMPRSILKTLSAYASPPRPNCAARSDLKRKPLRQNSGMRRRVRFSPFTKPRGESSRMLLFADKTKHQSPSGFSFSSVTEAEKISNSRRNMELQTMQTLCKAAKRRPRGIMTHLIANLPGLKRLNTWVKTLLKHAKISRNAISRHHCASVHRRYRSKMLHRALWTELDDAYHGYVQKLALSKDILHPKLSLHNAKPLAISYKLPQPNFTPVRRDRFANLLLKEGIPFDNLK
ncbi:hypothetical protein CCR75_009053 [Bremia lactucae]|uniref:Uncharacterized protein n=1 Tax=Bremia lactucae TaxID=4779 RepID=A0A976NZB6_BRELC|nr:hypothetical protein CCR75_009053 [Bremia lactucae]